MNQIRSIIGSLALGKVSESKFKTTILLHFDGFKLNADELLVIRRKFSVNSFIKSMHTAVLNVLSGN